MLTDNVMGVMQV